MGIVEHLKDEGKLRDSLERRVSFSRENLRQAAKKFVVVDAEKLFIRANVVNGRPPKEYIGYDSELELEAALVAVEPLIKEEIEIDAVMGVAVMGTSFGLACMKVLERETGQDLHWIVSEKKSVEEAKKLEVNGMGIFAEVDSFTRGVKQAVWIPRWVDEVGAGVTNQSDVQLGKVRENLIPGQKVLVGDDFFAYGSTGLAIVEMLTKASTEVVGFCAYVSKNQQEGISKVAEIHLMNDAVRKPVFVSAAVGIERIVQHDGVSEVVLGENVAVMFNKPVKDERMTFI